MLLHLAPSLRTKGIEDWYRIDIGPCLVGNNVSLNFPTNIAAISTLSVCHSTTSAISNPYTLKQERERRLKVLRQWRRNSL